MALIPAVQHGFGNVAYSSIHDMYHCNPQLWTVPRLPANGILSQAWCAVTTGTVLVQGEWAQVTFPFPVRIVRVTVMGRGDNDQRVTQLQLVTSDLRTPLYPQDPNSGPLWDFVGDGSPANNTHLAGNIDRVTPKSFEIDPQNGGRVAQAIRIVPTACNLHCSMRFEVYVRL